MALSPDHIFYNELTDKQIALIMLIEETVGVEFTCTSFLETSNFIKKYRGHPNLPVTEHQQRAIGAIENSLHLEFRGKCYKDAFNFISKHIDESIAVTEKAKELTPNQKNIIPHIEKVLGVKFAGSTKMEAVAFIGKYLEDFKSKRNDNDKELREKGLKKY
jgi:hypothetical protein